MAIIIGSRGSETTALGTGAIPSRDPTVDQASQNAPSNACPQLPIPLDTFPWSLANTIIRPAIIVTSVTRLGPLHLFISQTQSMATTTPLPSGSPTGFNPSPSPSPPSSSDQGQVTGNLPPISLCCPSRPFTLSSSSETDTALTSHAQYTSFPVSTPSLCLRCG